MSASAYQPRLGANLTNANVTKQPAADKVGEYFLPLATLTANRQLILDDSGAEFDRQLVRIIRMDRGAFSYEVFDDSSNLLFTFPASQTEDTGATFYFDQVATAWKFLSYYKVGVHGRGGRGTDLESDSTIHPELGELHRFDYFRITSRDDPSDYIRYTDAYGEIADGEEIVFYNDSGQDIVMRHMQGGADVDELEMFLIDGREVNLPTGYSITFRRDDGEGAFVQLAHPQGVYETEAGKLVALRNPKFGTNLTDANQTLQPFTDKASQYTQVTALTANRTKTLGTTTVVTGTLVRIVREDTAAFTLAIVNGGGAAGTLHTFAASPTEKQAATFYYNGADWVLVGFEYLTAG